MPLAPPSGACDDSSRRLIEVGPIEGKRRPMSVPEAERSTRAEALREAQ
jgi:hypothetical protein